MPGTTQIPTSDERYRPPTDTRRIICRLGFLLFLTALGVLGVGGVLRAQPYDPDLGANWRCGNLIMEKGLYKFEVIRACGQPRSVYKSHLEDYGEIEKLVYGPDSGYLYTLVFFQDRLLRIDAIRQ
jgi:hypothetical protein